MVSAGIDNPGTDKAGTDNPGTDRPATDKAGIECECAAVFTEVTTAVMQQRYPFLH